MSDKDQFTFDDDDDFPETDLSSAFSDGEHETENPVPDIGDAPEPDNAGKGEMTSGASGSRTRILLLVLLLVIAGAGGAYYFMDLGGTTPNVPTAPVPAKKAQKTVAVPPQPARTATEPTQPAAEPAKPAEKQTEAVTVSVPPPPPPAEPAPEKAADKAADKAAAVEAPKQTVAAQPDSAKPQAAPATVQDGDQPAADKPDQKPAETAAAPSGPTAAMAKPATPPVPQPEAAKTVAKSQPSAKSQPAATRQAADGAFMLDAGSYLFDANRDALVAKISKLGYEPVVTPVDAKLDMTRLRLGTFEKDEVDEALAFARSIEPGAYTAPAGDGYVIYAGTFLMKGSVDKLTRRFLDEGIKVYPEPVQVTRTLSRIRFGGFASRDDAKAAAEVLAEAGVDAEVVKAR